MRYIESDENLSMRGPKLMETVKKDREKGLIPFFVSWTFSCPIHNICEMNYDCAFICFGEHYFLLLKNYCTC